MYLGDHTKHAIIRANRFIKNRLDKTPMKGVKFKKEKKRKLPSHILEKMVLAQEVYKGTS